MSEETTSKGEKLSETQDPSAGEELAQREERSETDESYEVEDTTITDRAELEQEIEDTTIIDRAELEQEVEQEVEDTTIIDRAELEQEVEDTTIIDRAELELDKGEAAEGKDAKGGDDEYLLEDEVGGTRPTVRVPGEFMDEASYAPAIMLWATTNDDEDSDDERRRRARREYDVAVYVHHEDEEFLGLCGNVSTGGLFVATRKVPPKGSLIMLDFLLPDSDEELTLEAEVRWISKEWDEDRSVVPGFGVRFIDVEDEEQVVLERLVQALASGDDT